MATRKCRWCPKNVLWAVVEATGKAMPLNPGGDPRGNVLSVGHNGENMLVRVLTNEEVRTLPVDNRYSTHFMDCAGATRRKRTDLSTGRRR